MIRNVERKIASGARTVAAVAFGVAVLLSADPPSVAAAPSAIVSIVAATVAFIVPHDRQRGNVNLSVETPSNDP